MSSNTDLSGKTALVTGATGGIGGAIARALAARGVQLALSGTRVENLESLKEELGNATILPTILPCRLDQADEVEKLIPDTIKALGSLDILVNNAGITRDGLAMRMKDEDWADVLAINLSSAFRLSRAALRPMMKQRHGRIISISSVVGSIGNPGQANYAAAKAGLEGMTRSLAAEVASRGVTVNCIAPGFIRSAMTDALNEQQVKVMQERIPAGRFGEGEDVAAAVLYLAGKGGSYVTGQTLHINGGMYMG